MPRTGTFWRPPTSWPHCAATSNASRRARSCLPTSKSGRSSSTSTAASSSRSTIDASAGQRFRHLRDGVLGAHLVEGGRDLSLLVDHECGADDSHVLLAVVHLLAPHTPLLRDCVLLVREQWEAQLVLLVELNCLAGASGLIPITAAFSF